MRVLILALALVGAVPSLAQSMGGSMGGSGGGGSDGLGSSCSGGGGDCAPNVASGSTHRLQVAGTDGLTLDASGIEALLPVLAANGSAVAPAYAFANATGTGMYFDGGSQLRLAVSGGARVNLSTSALFPNSTGFDLGAPAVRFDLYATNIDANGNTALGDAVTDTILARGPISNDLAGTPTGGSIAGAVAIVDAQGLEVVGGFKVVTPNNNNMVLTAGGNMTLTAGAGDEGSLVGQTTTVLTWDSTGVRGPLVATGTPTTWAVPAAEGDDTITLPTCTRAGQMVLVDDTDDGAAGVLCICRKGTDDTTLALVQVADNSTACVDP